MEFLIGMLALYGFVMTPIIVYFIVKNRKIKQKIYDLSNGFAEISPQEFFEIKKTVRFESKNIYSHHNFEGVYILYNKDKDMYYVGQGKDVLKRINAHFMGRGNGDVYADFKYGNHFTIKMIPLEKSEYRTLNELERNTIYAYNAYTKGYNKTRGNRG